MRRFLSVPSPDFAFGILLTVVWLFLAIQVSAGVVAPLARAGLIGA